MLPLWLLLLFSLFFSSYELEIHISETNHLFYALTGELLVFASRDIFTFSSLSINHSTLFLLFSIRILFFPFLHLLGWHFSGILQTVALSMKKSFFKVKTKEILFLNRNRNRLTYFSFFLNRKQSSLTLAQWVSSMTYLICSRHEIHWSLESIICGSLSLKNEIHHQTTKTLQNHSKHTYFHLYFCEIGGFFFVLLVWVESCFRHIIIYRAHIL